MKVGANTLVIRADSCGLEGFTWLNNEEMSVGDDTELGSDVTCKQTSTHQYNCVVESEFNLIVDTYEGHLAVQAWSDNCGSAEGLMGSCDGDGPVNDFVSASGSALNPDTELNVTNIYSFAKSWQPSTEESMFTDILPNAVPETAEMCLRSKAGNAVSEPVYSFTKDEVTVEIKFYLETVEADCATLWSYKSEKTFSVLICDEYVNVYFNNQKTEIKALNRIQSQTWYHLSTVWDDSALQLDFFLAYYISGSQSYELASAAFGESPLIPGGIFMIGQMHYDTSMDLEVMGWSFDGYFDEFTIWKKKVDLEFVILNAFTYKAGTEDGLANLWRFNEGYGTVSMDSSALQLKMEWVSGPRSHPEWAVCGYTMEYPILTHHVLRDFLNTYQDVATESMCTSLLEKTGLQAAMTVAAWLKFYQQCLFNIYARGDTIGALEVLVALSDAQMVQESDKVSDMRSYRSWPARMLCSDFSNSSFHGWSGESCDTFCLAGTYDSGTGDCVCSHGFWNTSCNQICPYARNSPCGGGVCIDGECTCTGDRYDASSGCKECSAGWSGADCSSAAADVSGASKRMGTSFSLGHTIMFDGQGYDIRTPGQYVLIETSDVGLYVRMKPVSSYVVIQQLWVQVNGQQFTIQTPLLDNEPLIFWHNAAEVEVIDSYTITGSVTISWEDQTSMKIDLSSYGNLEVVVIYLGSYLDLQVVVDSSSCPASTTGLLGNCDNNLDNDFYSSNSDVVDYHDITQDTIDSDFVNKFAQSDNSGFVYTYPGLSITEPESMASGYSLFFNQWGIMSAPLPASVFDGTKNTTFDIKVKISSNNGLILGYSADSKFSVFFESGQLKLWANGQKYATNFTFTQDEWTHLFVSHDMLSDTVTVTVFIDSLLSYQETLSVPNVVFNSGGYFILGYWQIKPPASFGKMVGMIGTLRVWDKVLDDYVMYDASITQIVAGYENLVILYEFTEGSGLTSYDSVNSVGVSMPRTGEVTWFITDMPQAPKSTDECPTSSSSEESISSNIETCQEMLQSATLQSACDDLGADFVASYFLDACQKDFSYTSSLKALVDVCTTIVDPPTSPVTEICTDGTDDHYQTVCSEFCKFGTPSKSGCECHSGYWGETCDGVCPGGSDNPCYGHGICDLVTGQCGCFQGFSELQNCSQCEAMYIEPECEIRYPPTYNATENVVDNTNEPVIKSCMISSVGMVINFMEISYDFKQVGQFYLVNPDSGNPQVPDIRITTTSCFTSRSCITSLYLAYKADTVDVQGSSSSAGDITITLNNAKQYTSTVVTGFQDLEIDNTRGTNYWFKSLDGELQVLVSHSSTDARYLQVSVYMNNADSCIGQESICGSCTNYTLGTNVTSYDESWTVPGGDGDSGGSNGSSTAAPGGSTTVSGGGSGGDSSTTASPGGGGGGTTVGSGGGGGSTTVGSGVGGGGTTVSSGGAGGGTTAGSGDGGGGTTAGSGGGTTAGSGGGGGGTTAGSGSGGGGSGTTTSSPGDSGSGGGDDSGDDDEDTGGNTGDGGPGGWGVKFKDTNPDGDPVYTTTSSPGYTGGTGSGETTTASSGGGSGGSGGGGSTTLSPGGSGGSGSTTEGSDSGGSGGSGSTTAGSGGGSGGSGSTTASPGGGSGGSGSTTASSGGGSGGSGSTTASSGGGSGGSGGSTTSSPGGSGSTTVSPGGSGSECTGESSSLGESHSDYESRVSTDILKGVFNNEKSLTLSFKMNAESGFGTILTYTHETVFDVYLEYRILKFAVGNDLFNSGITIPLNEWVHLSLVWSHVTKQMIVYSTPLEYAAETDNFLLTVPDIAFNNYGILTIGSFNPPFDPCVVDPLKRNFVGQIDEFFLLDTALEASEEANFRNDSVSVDDENLKLYYNFDNVDSYVIPDLVNGNDLIVDTPSWKEPAVVFPPSEVPITPNRNDDNDEAVDTTDDLIDAEAECNKYFNNTELRELCGSLVNIDMYWDSCFVIMEATGDSSKALEAALQYAEACNFMIDMTTDSGGSGGDSSTTLSPTTTASSGGGGGGSGTTTASSGGGGGGSGTTTPSSGGGGGDSGTTTPSSGGGGGGSATTTPSSGGGGGDSGTTTPSSGGGGSGTTIASSGGSGSGTTTVSSGGGGGGYPGDGTISNPLQLLCHEDPVATGYVGLLCDIPCQFPDPNGDGLSCVCANGYWGTQCDSICPGGAENPCNGNGACDQTTGECHCSSNFVGDSCNECASGWVGGDCQLIIQDKVPGAVSNFYSCSLTSDKHLGTFDGAYLSLDTKEDGVFVLYLDSALKIDIQLGPCSMYPKCVLSVGFAAGGNIATIIPQNTGVVKMNGEVVLIDNYVSLSSSYRLKNPSTGNFYLKGPSQFSVDVSVQPSFLNIYISSKTCPDASGTVGICSGCGQSGTGHCASDDLLCLMNTVGIVDTVLVNETVDTDTIIDYFDQYYTEYNNSVFAAANETQITTGYAVKLGGDNSYISYPPFGPDVFPETEGEGGSKSIEVRVAFESADGGTVFSYATDNKTFGVVIEDGKFVVQYGTDTYPTGIDVMIEEWCNVGISYDETTGEVLFDHIYGDSGVHRYTIIDDIGPGALDVNGTLTVGQWNGITTNVTSYPPPGSSEMLVDRVLVWDKGLSPNDFESNWDVNKITAEDGLASIYNMDEGTGSETRDVLTDNVATIDPDSSWFQSDVDIIPSSSQGGGDTAGPVVDEVAEQVCTELKESLMAECSDLTALLDNMYKTCYDDVSNTGNADDSMDSALLASKECSKQLDIDEPLTSSCNDFPSRTFPGVVGESCDIECLHGTYSAELGCECDEGYYGSTCSDVCPGGPVPPCSGHGTCQSDGTCLCEPNWAGDSICSSCANNYSPPDCDEQQVKSDDTCTRTQCSMSKGGKVIRMDCTKKTHDETGDVVLLSYGSLEITVC